MRAEYNSTGSSSEMISPRQPRGGGQTVLIWEWRLGSSSRRHDQGDANHQQRRVKPEHSEVGNALEIQNGDNRCRHQHENAKYPESLS